MTPKLTRQQELDNQIQIEADIEYAHERAEEEQEKNKDNAFEGGE